MAEKPSRNSANVQAASSSKTATTLMAYAQLEIDNSSTCIPRLCKFSIVRLVLNRPMDGGDSNAVVVAVKIQSNKRMFRCCEIPLQQDGTVDEPVNLQYLITYPHYFKRDINRIQIYVQRRKNRPMIGYKTLARGEINLNQVIQRPQSVDLNLYFDMNEKSKQQQQQQHRSTVGGEEFSVGALSTGDDSHKRLVGYVSIVSLSSTLAAESTGSSSATSTRPKLISSNPLTSLSSKHPSHHQTRMPEFDKSFNEDDEYFEEEEINSELDDSDIEYGAGMGSGENKNKQKFNPVMIRNKLIQMFKRKGTGTTPGRVAQASGQEGRSSHHRHHDNRHQQEMFSLDRQSDIEEDPSSDISDSTIPVDQWSIESVPKPGFTPVEQLQLLTFSEDDLHPLRRSTNPFDSNDSPLDSESSDLGADLDRAIVPLPPPPLSLPMLEEKPSRTTTTTTTTTVARESVVKQLDELYGNDRLPETVLFLYTGLNQSNITAGKFKEYNLSVISLSSLTDAKIVLTNLIQRIQKCTGQSKEISVIRVVLLGNDAFVNSFLQSYVECLASRPHEYMNYFRFYFVPLVFSYLAKFLGSLDAQYETFFGGNESTNEMSDVRDLSQKIIRYLKTSQRTLALPVGEVMLNRKGQLPDEDSSPTFLPFFCYVRLGTLSSSLHESQTTSIDDSALFSASLSLSLSPSQQQQQQQQQRDSSDDENPSSIATANSPPSIIANSLIRNATADESTLPGDVAVDYWTTVGGSGTDNPKEKKEGTIAGSGNSRTIKSSLKSNIRVLTVTRKPTVNIDGKVGGLLTMTYVTREKKQKIMKFGKKIKDIPSAKIIEPRAITGINRLVCTSKSHNVELKVNVDGQEWNNVKFFQISSQWHTHIKYFPLALFIELRNN